MKFELCVPIPHRSDGLSPALCREGSFPRRCEVSGWHHFEAGVSYTQSYRGKHTCEEHCSLLPLNLKKNWSRLKPFERHVFFKIVNLFHCKISYLSGVTMVCLSSPDVDIFCTRKSTKWREFPISLTTAKWRAVSSQS
jgi:hypothetical protein